MDRRPRADLVVTNAELLTCRAEAEDFVGHVSGGAVAVSGERIVAAGRARDVAAAVDLTSARTVDADGRVVLPGFVDCHTHVVFGGTRVDEYAARLTGADLAELERRGLPVGIAGTVRETRALGVDALVEQALPRLDEMLNSGTTTAESKSGYALTVDGELRLLEANRRLDNVQPVDVVSTFLGAHALPDAVPRERYVTAIVEEMIPRVASEGLAKFCDVYCESGYFTPAETRRILSAGVAHGLRPKLHLDAYEHTGAAALAAEIHCISADHLNFTRPDELRLLADAGVVAVVMPALDFAVAHPRPVDVRRLLAHGLTVALATDICPGCWAPSMQFAIALACRSSGMSPAAAIRAATIAAAMAIGREDEVGSLEAGKLADMLILDVTRYEDLAYKLGRNAVATVFKRGTVAGEGGAV